MAYAIKLTISIIILIPFVVPAMAQTPDEEDFTDMGSTGITNELQQIHDTLSDVMRGLDTTHPITNVITDEDINSLGFHTIDGKTVIEIGIDEDIYEQKVSSIKEGLGELYPDVEFNLVTAGELILDAPSYPDFNLDTTSTGNAYDQYTTGDYHDVSRCIIVDGYTGLKKFSNDQYICVFESSVETLIQRNYAYLPGYWEGICPTAVSTPEEFSANIICLMTHHPQFLIRDGIPDTLHYLISGVEETLPPQIYGQGHFKSEDTTYNFSFMHHRGLPTFDVDDGTMHPYALYDQLFPDVNVPDDIKRQILDHMQNSTPVMAPIPDGQEEIAKQVVELILAIEMETDSEIKADIQKELDLMTVPMLRAGMVITEKYERDPVMWRELLNVFAENKDVCMISDETYMDIQNELGEKVAELILAIEMETDSEIKADIQKELDLLTVPMLQAGFVVAEKHKRDPIVWDEIQNAFLDSKDKCHTSYVPYINYDAQ